MWKRLCFAFLIVLITSFCANAQLNKGNWLLGGNGSFLIQEQKAVAGNLSTTRLQLSPNIGYFFIDKLAIGLKPRLDISKNTIGESSSVLRAGGIGPFVRYYFLPQERLVNILTEVDYQYLTGTKNYRQDIYTLSAGPVVYFNSSVGLEFTLNYEFINRKSSNTNTKTFFFGLGFQIHLEN